MRPDSAAVRLSLRDPADYIHIKSELNYKSFKAGAAVREEKRGERGRSGVECDRFQQTGRRGAAWRGVVWRARNFVCARVVPETAEPPGAPASQAGRPCTDPRVSVSPAPRTQPQYCIT